MGRPSHAVVILLLGWLWSPSRSLQVIARFSGASPNAAEMGHHFRTHASQQTASYSITSSAVARSAGGTVSPSALAVLRLTTNSYLMGACTGRSAGFAPLRMR